MELILHVLLHAIKHSALDTVRLIPFLFVTYFLMELLEHATGDKVTRAVSRSGKVGPLVGALLGVLPQCGFSGAGASLYSGRVITLGTLFAIFLSTSDEMLPVMISSKSPISTILIILGVKIVIGLLVGFCVDILFKRQPVKISHVCQDEDCHCEENGALLSALRHTVSVSLFILSVGFALEAFIGLVGEDVLARIMSGVPVLSNIISATVGLIPNCASSVIITELYLEGVISAGAMLSGLLTGAGVGTLVLIRTNKNPKENLFIILALWGVGVVFGLLLDLVGLGALL